MVSNTGSGGGLISRTVYPSKKMQFSCFEGINGEKLVAIAGGNSNGGIEVWNSANGSVSTLNSTFPMAGSYPQMIAVNGNTELILYETADSSGSPKGIWKFSQVTNTWTKLGEMLQARGYFSALPVEGVSCP
jgi:hypothetical protein